MEHKKRETPAKPPTALLLNPIFRRRRIKANLSRLKTGQTVSISLPSRGLDGTDHPKIVRKREKELKKKL